MAARTGKVMPSISSSSKPGKTPFLSALLNKFTASGADQIDTIAKEFDVEFYRTQHPKVAGDKKAAIRHYIENCRKTKSDPNIWFSTEYYLKNNKDVRNSGINPFYHYLRFGRKEGRIASYAEDSDKKEKSIPEKVVGEELKAEFYLDQVDPKRLRNIDPLRHYCASGWRNGFDPSPDFSTSYYLEANEDVAKEGINPFYHYLSIGRLEGRPCRASSRAGRAKGHSVTPKARPEVAQPRTGVVAMVKNEGDIIQFFAAHLLKFFDEIVFVDHQSSDSTKAVIEDLAERHANVTRYSLAEPAYIQDVVSNFVVADCEALKSVDWVMFLDADEFLPFRSRDEFAAFLKEHEAHPVISFRWKNIIPVDYWSYRVDDLADREFYVPSKPSPFKKIAFQPGKMGGAKYWINQGNHSISRIKGMDPLPDRETSAILFHLPIRSSNQLAIKLNQGALSNLLRNRTTRGVEGQHWFRILQSMKSAEEIRPELLNGVAMQYGTLGRPIEEVGAKELGEAGFQRQPIAVASVERAAQPAAEDESSIAELMFRLGAAIVLDGEEQTEEPVTEIAAFEGGVLRRSGEKPGETYQTLPPRSSTEKAALKARFTSPARAIATLLADSYLPIRNLTPTAWGGHIPFMFTIASVARPRRFVELGSHHGASFFAFCQAMERAGAKTEAIAIDSWQGDEQAGFYDDRVFDNFKFILRPYADFAHYIKGFFDDAAPHFAAGSIDLLHIDGLHTYAAVRNDFETWLPKMSSEGLVMFHDINVHERDFGVWRLWDELKTQYPAAEFRHSHGLGLLYVGDDPESGARAMVEAMAEPDTARALQTHFESVGELSPELAQARMAITRNEKQMKTIATRVEGLAKIKQKNAQLEKRVDGLLKALKRERD